MLTAEIHGLKAVFADKPKIAEVKPSKIRALYARIQPVVRDEDDDLVYMKPCNTEDVSFLWERSETMTVKAQGLKSVGEIATLHRYGYHGFFKPSIAEVLAQIPEEFREKERVVAFETIGPDDVADLRKQNDLVQAGFHVARTILYAKDPTFVEKEVIPATRPEEEEQHPSIKFYPIDKLDREDKRLLDTFYTVEATSEEKQQIWCQFSHQSTQTDTHFGRLVVQWDQDSLGYSAQIGEVARMPVCLTGFFAIIEGKRVLFWTMESMVTHFKMGEEWIRKVCPNAKGHTNCGNFHNVLHAISDATGRKIRRIEPEQKKS